MPYSRYGCMCARAYVCIWSPSWCQEWLGSLTGPDKPCYLVQLHSGLLGQGTCRGNVFFVYSCKWVLPCAPPPLLLPPLSQLQNHCSSPITFYPLFLYFLLFFSYHNTLCLSLFLASLCPLLLWSVGFVPITLSLHLVVPSSLCPLPTHFSCKDFSIFLSLGLLSRACFQVSSSNTH